VSVYNSHKHPYQDSEFNGVTIIHCKDPEHKIGTAGQFLYDFNCIRDSRKRKFDIILQLGYTSSSVWSRLFPKKTILITNMDGLEWKRTKFSKKVQRFLKYAESLAVKHSDYLISDSIGIQQYIKEKYIKDSSYIPYGAEVFTKFNSNLIKSYNISSYKYDMLIARLEPENSIETILDGVAKSNSNLPFLVIGNNETKFGEYLKHKFDEIKNIKVITKKKYAIKKNYFIICNRFWKHKNHGIAFEAFSRFLKINQNYQLVCTGDKSDTRYPEYFNDLKKKYFHLIDNGDIRILGVIPRNDQLSLLINSEAVIQPTLYEGGPGGFSSYEAIAYQKKLVLSNIPINKEIKYNKTLFFNPLSSKDLFLKLKLINSKKKVEKNNKKIIELSNYNKIKLGKSLFKVINQIINDKN